MRRLVPTADLPKSWAVTGLALVFLFLAGITILWLEIDTRPPAWDRANHAERAFHCSEILATSSSGLFGRAASISGFYPPLIHCIAGAIYLVAPVSKFALQAVIYAFLVAAIAATYLLGSSLGSRALGLVAASLVAVAPLIQVESRVFMLDIPLMAFVTGSYLAALRSEGFARPGASCAAGIVTGLGLLTKWTLLIYTLPGFLTALCLGLRRRDTKRSLLLAGLAAVIAGVIAGPWYAKNLFGLAGTFGARAVRSGEWEGDPVVLSPASVVYYLAGVVPQLGVVAAALFFVGLGILLTKRGEGLVLALNWIVPWAFFTLIRNKDLRYTLPLIPLASLVASYGLLSLRPNPRRLAMGLLVACSIWQVLASGFGILSGGPAEPGRGVPLLVADPARREHWPIEELLEAIESSGGRKPVAISVVPDYPEFSRSNFRYLATVRRLPYRFGRAWDEDPLGFDYVVTKTGDQGPEFSTRKARRVMERISNPNGSFQNAFARLARFPLPTGDEAVLFKREIQPVTASGGEVLDRLERGLAEFVRPYAQRIEVLRIELRSDREDVRVGRISRVEIFARRADIGDFRRKPAHVEVADIWIELRGVVFNPHALLDEGRLELLDVAGVEIRRAAVTEQALGGYLASDPELKGIQVSLGEGAGRVEVRRGFIRAAARVRPRPPGAPLGIEVVELSLWGVRLPPQMMAGLVTPINLEERLETLPVAVAIGEVSIDDGRIQIRPARRDTATEAQR